MEARHGCLLPIKPGGKLGEMSSLRGLLNAENSWHLTAVEKCLQGEKRQLHKRKGNKKLRCHWYNVKIFFYEDLVCLNDTFIYCIHCVSVNSLTCQ